MNDSTKSTENRPPRSLLTDPEDSVFVASTGAAASADLWTGYTADAGGIKKPQGKCWLELEAAGATAYVRFARTATTATTAADGAAIVVGTPRRFYVDPTKDLYLDHFCVTTGTIKWRRVGPIGERQRA